MFRLRELERKDLPVINKWRNKEELISLLGTPFRFINVDVDIKWYESYMLNRNSAVRCAITEFDNDEILGLVSLTSINYVNLTAEFHIMIGEEKSCGKGMGTFAVKAMIEHAFYNMNLRRIELGVLADNYRALHVYEKVGFKKEDIKRQAIYKKGKYVDLISCAILRDEYASRKTIFRWFRISNVRSERLSYKKLLHKKVL